MKKLIVLAMVIWLLIKGGDQMKSLSVKLGVILIGITIFGYAEVWGVDQPGGFMGMKWGESIEQCKEKGLAVDIGKTKDNTTDVLGKGSSIEEIGVGVNYSFYKNKLYFVTASIWGDKDFNSLKFALTDKYGKPKSSEPLKNIYGHSIGVKLQWDISDVIIELQYNSAKNEGNLSYAYKPFLAEQAKDMGKEIKKIKESL
jgi:hypothetical protein